MKPPLSHTDIDYRQIVETVPCVILRMDRAGRITFVNRYGGEFFGYAPAELLGRTVMETIVPERDEQGRELAGLIASVLANPRAMERVENENVTRNGTRVVMEWTNRPVVDESGEVVEILSIGVDVTERRRTRRERRERIQFLDSLLEAIPGPIFYKDAAGVFLGCNEAYREFLGLGEGEQVVGKSAYDIVDRELADFYTAYDRELLAEGGVRTYEVGRELPGGRHRDVIITKATFSDAAGDPAGIVGVISDITEQKRIERALAESESLYRTIFETTGTASGIIEPHGAISLANSEFARLTGYDDPADRPPWVELFRGPSRQRVAEALAARRRGADKPAAPRSFEAELEDATDAVHNVLVHVEAIPGTTRCVFSIQDLTDRYRAQKLEAVGALAGGVAHDFNNILTPIIMNAERVLAHLKPESPYREDLDDVLAAAAKARDLVQQILDFSRKSESKRIPFRLGPLVKETLKMMRAALPAAVSVQADVRTDEDLMLGDPTQMHQVLLNLCANAAHAMREQGTFLAARLERIGLPPGGELPEGDYLELTIADDGEGIPPEARERIFEPFYTTKRPGEGSGLGLAVAHGIVATHGGAIGLGPPAPTGTTFRVLLPALAERPKSTAARVEPRPEAPRSMRGTVLVVDDEMRIAASMRRMLVDRGFQAAAETEGARAIALLAAEPQAYDIAVIDQIMPEPGGVDLAAELRAIRPDLPVLLVTRHGEQASATANTTAVDATLPKPVSGDALVRAVSALLDVEHDG